MERFTNEDSAHRLSGCVGATVRREPAIADFSAAKHRARNNCRLVIVAITLRRDVPQKILDSISNDAKSSRLSRHKTVVGADTFPNPRLRIVPLDEQLMTFRFGHRIEEE